MGVFFFFKECLFMFSQAQGRQQGERDGCDKIFVIQHGRHAVLVIQRCQNQPQKVQKEKVFKSAVKLLPSRLLNKYFTAGQCMILFCLKISSIGAKKPNYFDLESVTYVCPFCIAVVVRPRQRLFDGRWRRRHTGPMRPENQK